MQTKGLERVKLEDNYLEQVYAGVLGKVIGVYLGRPFEGWTRHQIETKFGEIDRYVHTEQDTHSPDGVPLIVADDDITGTFTFIRAIEDSGEFERTAPEFFGKTWLNYLVENKTILWWGGMGHSTEHTAYLRLKNGIPSPKSGSMALNSKIVAEQIGAQIFIDAFGLVAPGDPQRAVAMAENAARVSHDGEAVHAAKVVAAMVSAAFVEKDMAALLDIGVSFIPTDSLLAQVHRDVRNWSAKDGDWRRTYERIDQKYGYHCYGGNCHVIPNHALMVMAWSYAPDNFHQSQNIINTAGWDTDCNAANVGSVMGLVVGLDGINQDYEFQQPTADRLLMPTAEGTEGVSDCSLVARRVEAMGRKVMGWTAPTNLKNGAWHYFELPGALHGYMAEPGGSQNGSHCTLSNVAGHSQLGTRSLCIDYAVDRDQPARLTTPISTAGGGDIYSLMGCPKIYPGNAVRFTGVGASQSTTSTNLRAFVTTHDSDERYYSEPVRLGTGAEFELRFEIPALRLGVVKDLGLELSADDSDQGQLYLDAVFIEGKFDVSFPDKFYRGRAWRPKPKIDGWVIDADILRPKFSDDTEKVTHFGKNEGRGELICGSMLWQNYVFAAKVKIHLASKAGIAVRYQGKQRYLAVEIEGNVLRLVRRHYGDRVLAEYDLSQQNSAWEQDKLYALQVTCDGPSCVVEWEGTQVLAAEDTTFTTGGAGFFFENGIMGAREIRCSALS